MNKSIKKNLIKEILNNPKSNKGFKTEQNRIRRRFKSHVNMNLTERIKFLFQGSKYYEWK